MTRRTVALKLGFSCWLIYTLHFATNMVRENYLALAIGDHFSFRLHEYANLHDDIFETPGYGWHIGSNPGASLIGAIPYILSRPVIDRVVERVRRTRHENGRGAPPHYDAPTEKDRRFYEEAWRRGFDVKFGLASFVMQSFAMAVISALGVVVMYLLVISVVEQPAAALAMALLYAFGTPVFLRTGFLNHNLMLAHVGLLGFAILWNRWEWPSASPARRFFLAGVTGGTAVLLDYSGLVILAALWLYAIVKYSREHGKPGVLGLTFIYAAGALGPVAVLWFYQWRSFGHPFRPPQHWMPPVEYSDQGYQGVAWPQWSLATSLAFDYRFGLFTTCPLFLLAVVAPFVNRRWRLLPRAELVMCLGVSAALFLFFSCVQYTRWQFNTGIRYLSPAFPFLFLAVVSVLRKLPPLSVRSISVASVAIAWCMAMVRDVSGGKVELTDPDTGLGVLDPIRTVFTSGLQLPAITTLSRMDAYRHLIDPNFATLLLFVLAAVLVLVVWKPKALNVGRLISAFR